MQRSRVRKAGPMPKEVAEAVLLRDRWCVAHRMGFAWDIPCRGRGHIHHAVLRSQGGRDHPDDLLLLCERHHIHAHEGDRTGAEVCGIIRPPAAINPL